MSEQYASLMPARFCALNYFNAHLLCSCGATNVILIIFMRHARCHTPLSMTDYLCGIFSCRCLFSGGYTTKVRDIGVLCCAIVWLHYTAGYLDRKTGLQYADARRA